MSFKFVDLDQSKLVTRVPFGELVTIGERFDSEDILQEVIRLGPLAAGYVGQIPGYDQKMLVELQYCSTMLQLAVPERREHRSAGKQGARKAEAVTLRQAKWVLRTVVPVLQTAIQTRPPVAGQSDADRSKDTETLRASVLALGGHTRADVAALTTRLEGAASLVSSPLLTARVVELQGGMDLKAELQAALASLATASGAKQSGQVVAKEQTADLNALDGQVYLNLKSLANAGHAYFMARNDPVHAAMFVLRLNRGKSSGGDVPVPPAPVVDPKTT